MRAIEDTGRRLIANPMRDDGTRWVLDLGAYEASRDPRLRMLIFCHRQNPTGRAFSRAELERVSDFAIRYDLVVVSDEIHADIVYPGNTHGIPDPRNQYLKAVAEMSWMDYYVRGSGKKFAWRDVLKSVEGGGPQLAGEPANP